MQVVGILIIVFIGAMVFSSVFPNAQDPFEQVGNSWLYGVENEGPFRPETNVLSQIAGEPTPLVLRMLEEVHTGISLETVMDVWGPVFFIALIFGIAICASMLYCFVRIIQIRRIEREAMRAAASPVVAKDMARSTMRWQGILQKVTADDPREWRNAILEADTMLDELLDVLGYKGETMGDKMRQADVAAFNTIDFAWEAHQVRDRVMRDDSFVLDAREAKRVIKLYERVLKEFHFIPEG